MMNRVGNGHAWAALLLLAAACDGGGGGGEDKDSGRPDGAIFADAEVDGEVDGDTPGEDSGGPGEDTGTGDPDSGSDPDAGGGGDDGSTMMDADTTDTGTSADTGGGDTDAGSDAGTDSGPSLPANCAESAITAGTGGSVTSTDSRFTLTLAGGQLSADSTVRVCVVAAASAPQAVIDDGRVGDVYEITTTGGATFAGATATFNGHSAFPGPDSANSFTPVRVRTLAGGSAASGGNSVLSFYKAQSGSAATLTATVAGPGHVYAAPLEAAYRVEIASPKLTYVTGELVDLSPIVRVEASPTPAVATRTLEAEVQGCDLEPINNATPGHVINQAVGTRAGCSRFLTITRADQSGSTPYPNGIEGSTVLSNGNTVDLRNESNNPPRVFCKRPGTGWGATRLYFKNGTATDLTIEKRLDVTCAYSGDWIAVHDTVEVSRSGTTLSYAAPYAPGAEAWIAPTGITYTTVAPDAVRYPLPATLNLSTEGPANFSATGEYRTAPAPGGMVVATSIASFTRTTGPDRYLVNITSATSPVPPFYEFLGEAHVTYTANGQVIDCYPVSAATLALNISPAAGPSTTVDTLDGTVDVISIRAIFGGTPNTVVQRLVDASQLSSHQAVPLLTPAQQTELASLGAATDYYVGFYRVEWDEQRKIWSSGRVLPVACGTVLHFTAADVAP